MSAYPDLTRKLLLSILLLSAVLCVLFGGGCAFEFCGGFGLGWAFLFV